MKRNSLRNEAPIEAGRAGQARPRGMLLALAAAWVLASSSTAFAEDPGVFVRKVEGLSPAFLMGVDVSSLLALERSGVVFRDARGRPQDIFLTLRENGVNSARLRVWNRPFDEKGNGYGGGNCDIGAAIEIGKRAAARGISVLLDFHYSDFWADPSKQAAPRAWKGMAIDEKARALYSYTKDCLEKALDAGVDVRMIQVGNETTGALCGERNWIAIAKLMNSGSRAAREVAAERKRRIDVALHFTNPEKAGEYSRYVKILQKQKVDYDVFATSYYPYWHGTPENLTAVMKAVAEESGKRVMCAEFSYVNGYEDGDGFPNTISRDTACSKPYQATVQGQADALRDVIAAMAGVGEAAMGVYYWEPAWLPVPGKDAEERRALWEKHGSGWASSYAAEYDPEDAGKHFGGTSWDNQALFAFDGGPLASLAVWRLAGSGAVTTKRPDAAEEIFARARVGDAVSLPQSVAVRFNDGSLKNAKVAWEDLGKLIGERLDRDKRVKVDDMPHRGVAEYEVAGRVSEEGYSIPVLARVAIVEKNYVENPSFEDADLSMWKLYNPGGKTTELYVQDKVSDAKTGSKALHFWSRDKVGFTVRQTIAGLAPGRYKLSVVIHGGDAKNQDMRIFASSGGKEYAAPTDVDGWRNFRTPSIPEIAVTDGTVTIGASVSCDAGGWGSLDDFVLSPIEQ